MEECNGAQTHDDACVRGAINRKINESTGVSVSSLNQSSFKPRRSIGGSPFKCVSKAKGTMNTVPFVGFQENGKERKSNPNGSQYGDFQLEISESTPVSKIVEEYD